MTATESIIKFNVDRNLTDFCAGAEYKMLAEELQEFYEAMTNNDIYGMIDALSDLRVIATGATWKAGYNPELALLETCKEIHSRQGSMGSDGKWLKDKNQDPATLYKADYTQTRI